MTVADLIKALQAVPHTSADVVLTPLVAVGDFTGGAAEDLFTATAHGLSDGDAIVLAYESAAGVVTGAVGDTFYVIDSAANTFRLALTAGGAAVENTADGTAHFVTGAVSVANATSTGIQADGPGVDTIDPGYVTIS